MDKDGEDDSTSKYSTKVYKLLISEKKEKAAKYVKDEELRLEFFYTKTDVEVKELLCVEQERISLGLANQIVALSKHQP
ncbi:hypothetical protein DFA_09010 [Cavenderia fasciculata]|uniref:Uncharacterized protein n=1 Tax=Cavenderia fasciculata TaxID=261658 RepID=F4Q6G2_CACFS|nr:uncharacterized protein DFA_09010 [Cavenderia fasciculata]EGG16472.1 hypothetical protein DFA_09010 [Cavenderia fasciculata]|eukprot:XP_004354872.1 hypothetical protein DFA_09010 [Cavenderia fasciculata]